MAQNFFELIQALERYYGEGDPRVLRVLNHQVTTSEFYRIIKNVPGVTIIYNQNGSVRGWEYQNPFLEVETPNSQISEVNSNVSSTTAVSVKTPINTSTSTDSQTGWEVVDLTQGAKAGSAAGATIGGLVKLKKYIPAAVLLATTATKIGLQLNPEYWTTHTTDPILTNLKDIDPETYEEITVTNKEIAETYPGQDLFDGMLRTFTDSQTGESKGEMYVEQMAMAYMVESMMQAGAFDVDNVLQTDDTSDFYFPNLTQPVPFYNSTVDLHVLLWGTTPYTYKYESDADFAIIIKRLNVNGYAVVQFSDTPFTYTLYEIRDSDGRTIVINTGSSGTIDVHGITYYYHVNTRNISDDEMSTAGFDKYNSGISPSGDINLAYKDIIQMYYGGDIKHEGGVEGIGVQDGATVPTFTPGMSLSDIINLLDQTFPDMANKKIVQQVVQPDGTVKEYTYVPTPMPNPNPNPTTGTDPWDKPVTGDSTQNDTEIDADPDEDPDVNPNPIIKYIVDDVTEPPEPNDENTGSGSTPPIVLPTGSAKALFRIWNPTQTEIDNLGAWLWSSQFIDQLLKMFSNPMEAIISLHKVFVSPTIGGQDDITIGYLNSGVNSNYVSGQYVTVDCGSVSLSEFYQNVFDYPPFTEVSLYLPFVGIVKLDTSDVMRGSVNVVYHVDVVTGACLAEVNVIRDSSGGIIYTYTGNCAVQYPLSSGSYMGVVTSAVGLAAGAVATYATGGAALPFLLRHGAGAVSSARTNVQRSGNFSANAGAMGCKKPYFIISRPQSNLANNFNMFVGKPANFTTKIGACTGFISCTEVHIENCNGTDAELAELENLLKTGIII